MEELGCHSLNLLINFRTLRVRYQILCLPARRDLKHTALSQMLVSENNRSLDNTNKTFYDNIMCYVYATQYFSHQLHLKCDQSKRASIFKFYLILINFYLIVTCCQYLHYLTTILRGFIQHKRWKSKLNNAKEKQTDKSRLKNDLQKNGHGFLKNQCH